MSLSRIALSLIAVLSLSGCLSPQAITLEPVLDAQELKLQSIGKNKSISIVSSDQRDNKVFGTRGGVYGKTAKIQAANDIEKALTQEASRLITELGFNPTAGSEDLKMEFILQEFTYLVPNKVWVTKVDIHCKLKVVATNKDKTLSNTYDWETSYKLPFAPSAKHNEAYLNEALQEAMKLAFTDLKMLTFISK